jgi:hypothetical protein
LSRSFALDAAAVDAAAAAAAAAATATSAAAADTTSAAAAEENPAYYLLDTTSATMHVPLDTQVAKRPAAKRIVVFPELLKTSQDVKHLHRTRHCTDDVLSIMYARLCVLNLLHSWPRRRVFPFQRLGLGSGAKRSVPVTHATGSSSSSSSTSSSSSSSAAAAAAVAAVAHTGRVDVADAGGSSSSIGGGGGSSKNDVPVFSSPPLCTTQTTSLLCRFIRLAEFSQINGVALLTLKRALLRVLKAESRTVEDMATTHIVALSTEQTTTTTATTSTATTATLVADAVSLKAEASSGSGGDSGAHTRVRTRVETSIDFKTHAPIARMLVEEMLLHLTVS